MQRSFFLRYLAMVILVLSLASRVCFADGDCPSRPATSQERAAYTAMYTAVVAAVPSAPQNWLRKDESETKSGEFMPDCPGGAKNVPRRYLFQFKYKYDPAVREQRARAAVETALKGTPDQQSRLAELDKKHDELIAARKEARRSGDHTAVNRIKDQLNAVRAEQEKINEEISNAYTARVKSGEMTQVMVAGVPARDEAQVTIYINQDREWVPKPVVPVSLAGAEHSYWRSNDGGSLVILLGAWDPGTFRSTLARSSVITTAQTVVVEVRAERQMAEKLAREMKLDILKAQLR
jgi:hypothetical protein